MTAGRYLVFNLGAEKFGLPVETVERILPSQAVTSIPKSDPTISGVFDLRGDTIPVINVRTLLKFEALAPNCFVVVISGEHRFALAVDGVDKIADFDAQTVDAISSLQEDGYWVGKEEGNMIVLATPEMLIPSEHLRREKTVAA